jgi:hypothetical protein
MATSRAVNAGSEFCRDCGGPITERGEFAWCENTADGREQVIPKDDCRNLTMHDRLFCEHCRAAMTGVPQRCLNCGRPPTRP